MTDLHVATLIYRLVHGENVDYEEAEPLYYAHSAFKLSVDACRVKIDVVDRHATVEAARNAVEPFLRVWELSAALERGLGEMSFVYERAIMVDQSPIDGGVRAFAEAGAIVIAGSRIMARVGRTSYPAPPVEIDRDPDVDLMFARYCLFREGRATLSGAAYYCLTVLQSAAGNRTAACRQFAVERAVLNKIGDLSSEKGGGEARKAIGSAAEFLPAERDWLAKAILMLIKRAAEMAFDPRARYSQLTMADLPPLP